MKTPASVYAALVFGAGTLLVTAAPAPPLLVSPASNAVNVSTSPTLQVKVSEPGSGPLTVRFYGRLARNPGPDFTVAALPDTQYYSSSMNGGSPAIFAAQTDWIVANRAASNIAYVAHLGDIVNYGDTNRGVEELTAWRNVTNALYRLENPVTTGLPSGIPYGAAVGNHDQSPNGNPDGTTRYYNQFFGVPHFQRPQLLRRALWERTTTTTSTSSAPAAWISSPSIWSLTWTRIPWCSTGPTIFCAPTRTAWPWW